MRQGEPAVIPSTSWPRVALLCLAGVTAAFQVGKVPGQLHAMEGQLGFNLFEAGLTISIFNLIAALGGILIGTLADRFGNLRMIVAGLALGGAASALGSLASGAPALLASRAIEGFGFILATTATPSLIVAETAGADHGKALGLWSMYMPAGMSAMMLIAALLAGELSWRGIWLLTAALNIGYGIVVWLAFPEKRGATSDKAAHLSFQAEPDEERGTEKAAPGRGAGDGSAKSEEGSRAFSGGVASGSPQKMQQKQKARAAVRFNWTEKGSSGIFAPALRPGPLLLAGCFLVYAGNFLALTGFLPLMLERGGNASGGVAGLLAALVVAVNMTGNAASGFIAARGVRRPLIIAAAAAIMGAAGAGVFIEALPFAMRYGLALLFSAVGGVIPGTCFGAAQELAKSPTRLGALVGALIQGAGVGQLLGPSLVAAIVQAVGSWQGAAVFIAVGALINVALALSLLRLTRRPWPPARASST
jgi:MFS family permease